jgi:hypothetical protein
LGQGSRRDKGAPCRVGGKETDQAYIRIYKQIVSAALVAITFSFQTGMIISRMIYRRLGYF